MATKPNTRYINPIGPEFSLIHKDKEIQFLCLKTPPIIIGLTGPSKVGKTMIAKQFVTEHGFSYVGIANPLRKLARERGLINPDWKQLGNLICTIREHKSQDELARIAIGDIEKNLRGKNFVVVDSLLHPSEILLFKNSFQKFFMLGINAESNFRIRHAIDWGYIKDGSDS